MPIKSATFRLVFPVILLLVPVLANAQAQEAPSAKKLFEEERWAELVRVVEASQDRSAELEYEYGVALAHLERWTEAHSALERGSHMSPHDKRFPIELAGVAFRQKNNPEAIRYLRLALRLDAHDEYASEFLATVYFLQGNLEAAVKYWNRLPTPRPQIAALRDEPALRVRPALLDRAIAFSPASTLRVEELRVTEARLRNLDIFPTYRMDLLARDDDRVDAVLRARERNGFGNTKLEALLRTFRGVFFQEVTPEYYNLRGSAINIVSVARFDPDKRLYRVALSGPLGQDPRWRYRLTGGARNENWEVRNSFAGPAPVLGALNLRREEFVAEITRLVGWRWRWTLATEVSHRDFRSVVAGSTLTPDLLAGGMQLKQTAGAGFDLWRSAEHRLDFSADMHVQSARLWSEPAQFFEKVQATLQVHWLPQSRGDDFETSWRLRGGKVFGEIPFDELFMPGLERDNDLWMRAHIGTRHGRKGSAPLGRDYIVTNWETDKNVYRKGFFSAKLGPFVDTGQLTDALQQPSAKKWLVDAGGQAKLRVLGVGVLFSYGKDLRTGNNAFFATVGW